MSYNQLQPFADSNDPAARARDIKVSRYQLRLYMVDGECVAQNFENAWTESDPVVDALDENIHCQCVSTRREEASRPGEQKLLFGSLFPAPMSLTAADAGNGNPRNELYAPIYLNW